MLLQLVTIVLLIWEWANQRKYPGGIRRRGFFLLLCFEKKGIPKMKHISIILLLVSISALLCACRKPVEYEVINTETTNVTEKVVMETTEAMSEAETVTATEPIIETKPEATESTTAPTESQSAKVQSTSKENSVIEQTTSPESEVTVSATVPVDIQPAITETPVATPSENTQQDTAGTIPPYMTEMG